MLSHRDDVADVFDRVRGRLRRIPNNGDVKVKEEEGEQQSRVSVSTVQLGGDRFEITRVRTGVSRRARHLGRAEISFRRRYKRRLRRGGKKRVREEVRDVVSKGGRRRRTPPTTLKIIRMGLMFANASRERIDDDDDDDDDD